MKWDWMADKKVDSLKGHYLMAKPWFRSIWEGLGVKPKS